MAIELEAVPEAAERSHRRDDAAALNTMRSLSQVQSGPHALPS